MSTFSWSVFKTSVTSFIWLLIFSASSCAALFCKSCFILSSLPEISLLRPVIVSFKSLSELSTLDLYSSILSETSPPRLSSASITSSLFSIMARHSFNSSLPELSFSSSVFLIFSSVVLSDSSCRLLFCVIFSSKASKSLCHCSAREFVFSRVERTVKSILAIVVLISSRLSFVKLLI